MRILYLFNNFRNNHVEKYNKGLISDSVFLSMFRLRKFGFDTSFAEIESFLPRKLCIFLRRYINVYAINFFVFFEIVKSDIVIHINSFFAQFIFSIFFSKKPKWVLYDYSLTGLMGNAKTIKQKLLKSIISRSKGIIVISEEERLRLTKAFPGLKENIVFIRYGIDTNFFSPIDVKEEDYILSIGHDMWRDYKTLFEAVRGLNIKLIITDSKRAKKMQNMPDFVQVLNFTDEELRLAYAKAKLIVIPLDITGGFNDAMGCSTLVEAFSMGKPVIVTRTFTTESYVEDGHNALFVEKGNAKEMKDKIQYLLNDNEARKILGSNARKYAVEKCDAEIVATETMSFLKKIM